MCIRDRNFDNIPLTAEEDTDIGFKNVTVHDPSIVKDNGSYYIFGSHDIWQQFLSLSDSDVHHTDRRALL